MKRIYLIIAALFMLACVTTSCNEEIENRAEDNPIVNVQSKYVYPPIPSWAHVSSLITVLKSNSPKHLFCNDQPEGYFCGILLEQQVSHDNSSVVYYSPGGPIGIIINGSFLASNHLTSLADSAANGHLTFYSDINVMSSSLKDTLGFSQIPAGRYPAMMLGNSVYVQFQDMH